jgi:peptidoglycan hydrolase-like protein with peptidoglycan-binding domain
MDAQLHYTQSPPTGQFQYRYTATPASLKSLWKPGVYNVLTKGAVMTFQQVSHLNADGVAGPQLWSALLQAQLNNQHNPYPYAYVSVSMHQPEKLTIWSNGKTVLSTLVNTGISASPTATGTHPVYLQYKTQTMSGVDPSGQHYSDPGVPWVSYFYGGDAVHGFVRSDYGYPQSLGCVELPLKQAAEAWNYMHLGTLVTVS